MSATELFLAAWLSNWKPPLTGNILEVGGLILLVRLRPDGYSRVECLGRELRFTLRQLLLRHQNSARPSGSLVSRRGKVRGAVAIARSAGRKSAINGGNPSFYRSSCVAAPSLARPGRGKTPLTEKGLFSGKHRLLGAIAVAVPGRKNAINGRRSSFPDFGKRIELRFRRRHLRTAVQQQNATASLRSTISPPGAKIFLRYQELGRGTTSASTATAVRAPQISGLTSISPTTSASSAASTENRAIVAHSASRSTAGAPR
jgi:hypothetical protein